MTSTADKRAALAAEGVPWPTCDCHGEPAGWQRDLADRRGGRFRCKVSAKQGAARRRADRLTRGVCVDCQKPADTTYYCRPCADRRADLMAQPKHKLGHRAADARYRMKQAAAEGYRPTAVGQAVLAAFINKPTGEV